MSEISGMSLMEPMPISDVFKKQRRLKNRIYMLEKESYMLRNALHDAIKKPMGVVPHSAEGYYEPERWYKDGKI